MGVTNGEGRFAALTWTEADKALERGALLLLPLGSTEAHGPHLPLDTDVCISEAMAYAALRPLRDVGLEAYVLPTLAYGLTDFGGPFPGNISITGETLKAMIRDITRSLTQQRRPHEAPGTRSPKALVLINSHLEYDHIQVLRGVAKALSAEGPLPVIFPDKTSRRWVGTLSEEFQSASCHAGQYETSLVLAARPDDVRPEAKALPRHTVNLATAMRSGAKTFVEAGAPEAYCGAPAEGSAEEGEWLYGQLSEMIVTTVVEALKGEADL